jgi:hypothetical protein
MSAGFTRRQTRVQELVLIFTVPVKNLYEVANFDRYFCSRKELLVSVKTLQWVNVLIF